VKRPVYVAFDCAGRELGSTLNRENGEAMRGTIIDQVAGQTLFLRFDGKRASGSRVYKIFPCSSGVHNRGRTSIAGPPTDPDARNYRIRLLPRVMTPYGGVPCSSDCARRCGTGSERRVLLDQFPSST
jgi:hypothetical protein